MSGGLFRALTWLVAVAMMAGAVLPPSWRLECRCGAVGGVVVEEAAVEDAGAVGQSGCCARHGAVGGAAEREDTPVPGEQDEDDGCCACPGVCCVVVRPVLVDRATVAEAERASPGEARALTGPQTCVAAAHAGRLLRPPRA